MAKFNQGNIVLTNNEKIIHGGQEVLGPGQAANVSSIQLSQGSAVNNISNDTTLVGDSASSLATEHAVKTYVDNSVGTSGTSGTLDGLTDVEITTPQDGDALVYDSTTGIWINQVGSSGFSGSSGSSGSSGTSGTSGIDGTSGSSGTSGTSGIDGTSGSSGSSGTSGIAGDGTLNGLDDVTIDSLQNGQILVYDSGTTQWLNTGPVTSGDRGVFAGGDTDSGRTNVIDYITINSLGNATDFGDLTSIREDTAGTSNGTNERGVFGGGNTGSDTNVIDYITIGTLGHASDFGDLLGTMKAMPAVSNATNERGVFGSGAKWPATNVIQYITINSVGNSIDFGDMSVARGYAGGASNGTNERGVFACGTLDIGEGTRTNVIDYITINSASNATSFGDSTEIRSDTAGTSNGTGERGVFGGGGGWLNNYDNSFDTIDYVTINSAGNATDFGDLSVRRKWMGAVSNDTDNRGVFGGGFDQDFEIINTIDYITINSLGNASEFGDLTVAKIGIGATSNAASYTSGTVVIRENLSELDDVTITIPQDGDILVYDSTTKTWINQVGGVGGGTSGSSGSSGTSGIDGTSGLSGTSGTSGTSGATGTSGTSGVLTDPGTIGTLTITTHLIIPTVAPDTPVSGSLWIE